MPLLEEILDIMSGDGVLHKLLDFLSCWVGAKETGQDS